MSNMLQTEKRTFYGDIQNVNTNLIDWKPVEGQPGNYLKVLVIDEARHRVDFLFRQDPHAEFAKARQGLLLRAVHARDLDALLHDVKQLVEADL